jgi:Zn-dependent protease with chaperone function
LCDAASVRGNRLQEGYGRRGSRVKHDRPDGRPAGAFAIFGAGTRGRRGERRVERDEFDRLVRRLEDEARRRPRFCRLKAGAVALFGYAVVYGALLLALGLFAALVAGLVRNPGSFAFVFVKFGIPLGILIAVMLRAFWVRIDAPPGHYVGRAEAPALFALLDNVRARLKGPPIHAVLIDGQYNAAIVQRPRLGLFGWHRNYLVLGLPYLLGQTPLQAAGAIAHEYGHLAGAHGKFGAWVYRQARTWSQLMEALHRRRHWATGWFSRFVDWYYPRFSAYTFVLRRANEYEADRASVQVAGRAPTASGLVLDVLAGGWFHHDYWRTFWSLADERAEPVVLPHEALRDAFRAAYPEYATAARLERALETVTGTEDTHPSLADRLAAIGAAPAVPEPPAEDAATVLLGPLLPQLARELDDEWLAEALPAWKERHAYVQRAKARLAELDAREAGGAAPSADEALEHASLAEEFDGVDRAQALYRKALDLAPRSVAASFALGRLLVGAGDPRGLAHLDDALRGDGAYAYAVFRVAYPFLADAGRQQEAERYRQKAEERARLEHEAGEERGNLAAADPVTRHELPATVVLHVVEVLRRFDAVKRAWLVRKVGRWRLLPEWQVYVLIVKRGGLALGTAWGLADDIRAALQVPGYLFVVPDEEGWAPLRKQAEGIDGALVYST